MFSAALFTIAKHGSNPNVHQQMNKEYMVYRYRYTYIYIHTMKYYSAIKNNEIIPFVTTWTDLETIILSEVSQKDKYYMISLLCGI